MVIDRNYKFIFVELPLTATSAISKELRETYGSERIIYKHATYRHFLRKASDEQKKYKSVGTVRFQPDQIVSTYFKYKNDKEYQDKYRFGNKRRNNGTRFRQFISAKRHRRRCDFIVAKNATFEEFFLKYYKWPYTDWSILDHKNFDYIIHFENLSAEYKKVFTDVGVPVHRDLPQANKTRERGKDFWSYYETDKAKQRAKYVFGPIMRYWGYEFPESWNHIKEPRSSQFWFNILNVPSKLYWKYLM